MSRYLTIKIFQFWSRKIISKVMLRRSVKLCLLLWFFVMETFLFRFTFYRNLWVFYHLKTEDLSLIKLIFSWVVCSSHLLWLQISDKHYVFLVILGHMKYQYCELFHLYLLWASILLCVPLEIHEYNQKHYLKANLQGQYIQEVTNFIRQLQGLNFLLINDLRFISRLPPFVV